MDIWSRKSVLMGSRVINLTTWQYPQDGNLSILEHYVRTIDHRTIALIPTYATVGAL